MRVELVLIAMLLSMSAVTASTICEQGESETWGYLKLSDFTVSADKPVRVGDTVYYSFYVENVGSEPVKVGKGRLPQDQCW